MTGPTIVLVHGAFADGSSWDGGDRTAPGNADTRWWHRRIRCEGSVEDSAYLTSVVRQIEGPVLLVGHSYGGAADLQRRPRRTRRLVFVAAFAPDADEALGDCPAGLEGQHPDGRAGAAGVPDRDGGDRRGARRRPGEVPRGLRRGPPDVDGRRNGGDPAPDRRRRVRRAVRARRRGRRLPSWAVVATEDKAAGADIVRSMAERAGADIVEVEGSHVIMVSQPDRRRGPHREGGGGRSGRPPGSDGSDWKSVRRPCARSMLAC